MREQRKEMEEKVGIMDPTTRWPERRWVVGELQARDGKSPWNFWDLKEENKYVFSIYNIWVTIQKEAETGHHSDSKRFQYLFEFGKCMFVSAMIQKFIEFCWNCIIEIISLFSTITIMVSSSSGTQNMTFHFHHGFV